MILDINRRTSILTNVGLAQILKAKTQKEAGFSGRSNRLVSSFGPPANGPAHVRTLHPARPGKESNAVVLAARESAEPPYAIRAGCLRVATFSWLASCDSA